MKITIINGPNLNLLGSRETRVYGQASLASVEEGLRSTFPSVEFTFTQSNHEGDLIDAVQEAAKQGSQVVINPGGYTHTSVALRDAIAAVNIKVVEVHISNIYDREDFRRISLTAPKCDAIVSGMGVFGYEAGVRFLLGLKG
ncbi:type II 3-dehydroquinate dehydratase [Sanyastnella coralliicola]|uniref:type II 3-dehydroquinate dehydratase n=1 Tax=Sanyastnella coralliicola TaxID=3069118 RepID=UPI0027B99991|nr:type II 3-dehydroquinate dehydratase [Longitalea sp. SCSIO 12813]